MKISNPVIVVLIVIIAIVAVSTLTYVSVKGDALKPREDVLLSIDAEKIKMLGVERQVMQVLLDGRILIARDITLPEAEKAMGNLGKLAVQQQLEIKRLVEGLTKANAEIEELKPEIEDKDE